MSEGTAAGGGPGAPGAVSMLYLCLEVAGCPTVCRHCWAQGTGYGVMPLADIERVLDEAHRFCDDAGLAFDAYPMHEMAAHPDAARLFALFNAHGVAARGGTMFEPLTTTGVPLAVREDWREVLRAAADTGTVNLWVALHGVGEVHDRQVNRSGAYAETCLAIQRARAAGLSVGGNIFLTTASLAQLDELTAVRRRLPVNAALAFGVAGFLPTPRSQRNEQLRPVLPDLQPYAARIGELTAPANRAWWASLEEHTEAAYVRRALAGDWPAETEPPAELALVCRPDLGVYSGLAGLYRTRHGNLRADGTAAVLGRALAYGVRADDALWFADLEPLPGPAELAARYGDATGLGVHFGPESVRYLWLDRARRRDRDHR